VTVRFPAPGLYPIEILYNETQGAGAYLGFFSDIAGGPTTCLLCGEATPTGTVGVVPTAVLFPARADGLSSRGRGEKGDRLWLELSQPSGGVGDVIDGTVGLASSTERFAPANVDLPIHLQTSAGRLSEAPNVIPKGASSAKFKLILEKVGDFLMNVSSPGENIRPAQRGGTVCDDGDVEKMVVVRPTSEGSVGGPRIPFSLRFVDQSGTKPVKAKEDREYGLEPSGVVDVWPASERQVSGTIKKGQCVDDYLVSSIHPGAGTVTATFIKDTRILPFTFYLPLEPGWFVLTALGSVCGAFVRLQTRSRRTKKLLSSYLVALIAGVGLFLFYYYLPSKQGAWIAVGWGSAFLLGLAGGYLGPMAVDRIAKLLLPPAQRRTAQRGQA
jgi:hypothetical protein